MTHEELKQKEATYQASHDAYAEVVEWCNDETSILMTIRTLAAGKREHYAKQLAKLEGQKVVFADETPLPTYLAVGVRVHNQDGLKAWGYKRQCSGRTCLDQESGCGTAVAKDLTIIPNPNNDKQLEQELREMGVE